jgi:hypothetical protein
MFSSNTSSAAGDAVFVEDVFSTTLYTGNSSTQTITNGIDLAGKGGLVWIKGRTTAFQHVLADTVRGPTKYLQSNSTSTEATAPNTVPSFSASGFTAGTDNQVNLSGDSFVSWTFREQPKFFDVVTYTGDGTDDRAISHNLGSVPGCYIVKATSTTSNWLVYHRGNPFAPSEGLALNLTAGTNSIYSPASTAPTSTQFYVGRSGGGPTNNGNVNGVTYVAYLFAHNAGGFGLNGTDNVISCGSWTGNGTSGQLITLGYEPQFVLHRWYDGAEDWKINDTVRGMPVGGSDATLFPNNADAEVTGVGRLDPDSAGFIATTNQNVSGRNYLYIAIRKNMKS